LHRYIFSSVTARSVSLAHVVLAAMLLMPPSNPRPPYPVFPSQKRVVSSPIPQLTRTVRPRRVQPSIVAIKPPSSGFFEFDRFDLDLTVKPEPAQVTVCTNLRASCIAPFRQEIYVPTISQCDFGFQLTRAGPLRI
jgi:hypothetical protein